MRAGLERAAETAHVELIVVDNRYQPKVALRNADHLIRENLDLALEFQTDEAIAPEVAGRYLEAGIPLIAIDIPHPGATYFGANNYQAGLLAGRYLGRWARSQWNGRIDEVLLLELVRAGTLVHGRMSGVLAGLKETVPDSLDTCRIATLDGDGQFKVSFERVRKHLRESQAKYVLSARPTTRAHLAPPAHSRKPAAAHAQSSGRTRSPMRASSCASRIRRSSPRSATSPSAMAKG